MNKFYKIYNKISDVTLLNKTYNYGMKIETINKLINSSVTKLDIGYNNLYEIGNNLTDIRESKLLLSVPSYGNLLELNTINNNSLLINLFVDSNINDIINKTRHNCRLYIPQSFDSKKIDDIFGKYTDHPKVEEIVVCSNHDIEFYIKKYRSTKKLSLHIQTNNYKEIYNILNNHIEYIKSINTSLDRQTLSTYKVAEIINYICDHQIYDLQTIKQLENIYRNSYLI